MGPHRKRVMAAHRRHGTAEGITATKSVLGGVIVDGGDSAPATQGGSVPVFDGGDVTPPRNIVPSIWQLLFNWRKRVQVQASNVGVTSTGVMYDIGRPEYANPQTPFIPGTVWCMVGQQNLEPCINPHITTGHATKGTNWNDQQVGGNPGAGGFSTPVQLGG